MYVNVAHRMYHVVDIYLQAQVSRVSPSPSHRSVSSTIASNDADFVGGMQTSSWAEMRTLSFPGTIESVQFSPAKSKT